MWGGGPYGKAKGMGKGKGGAMGMLSGLLAAAKGGGYGGGYGGGEGWGGDGGKGGWGGDGGYGGYGGKGAYGKAMGGGGDAWGEAPEEEYTTTTKKKASAGWKSEVPGFKEALAEAFGEAGVTSDLEDIEELCKRCERSAQKQAKTFFDDERAGQKMTGSQCRAFIGEFTGAVMSGFSAFLYDKVWFDKVSWNAALLALTVNTFNNGKIFTRTVKTEILPYINDGLLVWSEEERCGKQFWKALSASGMNETHQKKAKVHLEKGFDDAHWEVPFGAEEAEGVTAEVFAVQEFVKAWMTSFANKAYMQLESGTGDGSPSGQVAAMTAIFQTLMDPDSPCLPLSLQPSVPPAPWGYIETCAGEVIAAQTKS